MRRTVFAAFTLLGATALGLTGCGDDGGDGGKPADKETAAAPAGDEQSDADRVKQDVEITSCELGERGIGVSATLEITNSASVPKAYHGTLNFLDASGATLAEGLFHSGTLEPGQSSTEEVPGQSYDYQGEISCELGEAEISDPK